MRETRRPPPSSPVTPSSPRKRGSRRGGSDAAPADQREASPSDRSLDPRLRGDDEGGGEEGNKSSGEDGRSESDGEECGTTLRDATAGDAAALAALARDSFTETFGHLYTPADLAAFLAGHTTEGWAAILGSPADAVLVAEADGELVGYARLGTPKLPFEPEPGDMELRQFYLLKPWHGRGLADRMMAWTLDEAERRGAPALYLSVFQDNERARRFYARHGFAFVTEHAFMVGEHRDTDHILRRNL